MPEPDMIIRFDDWRLDYVYKGDVLASAFRVEAGANKDKWRVFPGKVAEHQAGFVDACGNYAMIYDFSDRRYPRQRPIQPPVALVADEEAARWWLEFLGALYLKVLAPVPDNTPAPAPDNALETSTP